MSSVKRLRERVAVKLRNKRKGARVPFSLLKARNILPAEFKEIIEMTEIAEVIYTSSNDSFDYFIIVKK